MNAETSPIAGELLFVYAADSGMFNTLADIAHKLLSPDTYPCGLCALTHGTFRARKELPAFIGALGHPVRFLHRDEVANVNDIDADQLPAIYQWREGRWACCLCAEDIAACRNLAELELAIRQSLGDERRQS